MRPVSGLHKFSLRQKRSRGFYAKNYLWKGEMEREKALPCLLINLWVFVAVCVALTFDKVSQDEGTFLVNQTKKRRSKVGASSLSALCISGVSCTGTFSQFVLRAFQKEDVHFLFLPTRNMDLYRFPFFDRNMLSEKTRHFIHTAWVMHDSMQRQACVPKMVYIHFVSEVVSMSSSFGITKTKS